MQMKFMQRREEERKKINDDMVKQIRRELASDGEEEEDSEEEAEVGRRTYGPDKTSDKAKRHSKINGKAQEVPDSNVSIAKEFKPTAEAVVETQDSTVGGAGAWSRGTKERRKNKHSSGRAEELDLDKAAILAAKPSRTKKDGDEDGGTSDDEDAMHFPLAIKDQELIKRAFAGEDVVGEFEMEKAAIADEDDEKEVDNALPGWGSWVGDGIHKRERQKHQGKSVTKIDGVKKLARKDSKLDRVIISERRSKKV
jgi:U3 small nucleolar RNA-associated protein 14